MNEPARIHIIQPDLHLIELIPPLAGFEDFIGAWLLTGPETILVDVGPSATVPALVNALQTIGVSRLDYILLTHIHIDHAGGAGDLVRALPGTPVVCHKTGISHLLNPERLWTGSLKTLEDTARAYGPISPVPAELLLDAGQFKTRIIEPILTPGHAPHHVSYISDTIAFAGETAGVYLSLPDGKFYHRPATPPRFFWDTALASMDALAARMTETCCFGHFGSYPRGAEILSRHKEQLVLWRKIIGEVLAISGVEDPVALALGRLLAADDNLSAYSGMAPAVQSRERGFLINSIKGFIGYLESCR
ncbi:MAG: MBL fold metallo-hydrolase [Deltaproteobacteria bacterium]|nr:MBL fold metallo-hydrolase [Deltaproteobacteria bacterium]